MPMKREQYPANWKEISFVIRFVRAGHRCEWCGAVNGEPNPVTGSIVVLTVAHLGIARSDGTPGDKTDKMDVRPDNLAALCQRCHLNFDRPEIIETRARNRQAKQESDRQVSGQLSLMEE